MKGYVSVCPFDYLITMKCQQNRAGAVRNRTYRVRVNAVGNRTYRTLTLVGAVFNCAYVVRLETAPTGLGGMRCGWKPQPTGLSLW